VEAGAVEQIVGCVKQRKGADERAGQAFALQSCPGPGGVDLLEMIAPVELVREFEVVEDSKDGLDNFHRKLFTKDSCILQAMLADESVRTVLGTIERLRMMRRGWKDAG
jgi:hypothetical protein